MEHKNYHCVKCAGTEFDLGEIRVAGGFWSKIFDVSNKKYSAVTCKRCKHTEFYKAESGMLGNIFDLFTN